MNDYLSSVETFADMFKFLQKIDFLSIVFGPVYLTRKKIFAFDDKLAILDFEGTSKGIRSFSKHWDKVKN